MSTHDYILANQVGSDARTDLNSLFQAIVSQNSSATEPATMYAYMWWADTANDILKQRNTANTAWISMMTLSTGVMLQKDTSSGIAGLTLFKINFKNALNTFTSFFTNSNTAARTYTFPDRDITVAGVDDITGITTTTTKLPDIYVTPSAGALTISSDPVYIDIRSATLDDGRSTTLLTTADTLVIPSGATLGAPTTVVVEVMIIEINAAGVAEKAVVNRSNGVDISETGLISTTAISTGSDSAGIFYSTTARTNVPYKVIGLFRATNTAGAWGSPTLVQGAGGRAAIGFKKGVTTVVTGSRSVAGTYYNTTGSIMFLQIAQGSNPVSSATLTVGGVVQGAAQYNVAGSTFGMMYAFVNPGESYSLTGSNLTIYNWAETLLN